MLIGTTMAEMNGAISMMMAIISPKSMVFRNTGFRKRQDAMMSPAMTSYPNILLKTFFWNTFSSTSGSRTTSSTSMM